MTAMARFASFGTMYIPKQTDGQEMDVSLLLPEKDKPERSAGISRFQPPYY
ncbi:MAG: hypothetical protein QM654_01350 [Dysgonamonadaceae bacterium]